MHITMVKIRLQDGSECRKCLQATEQLQKRGLWERIDEVVWAVEGDPTSAGTLLARRLGIDRAPFFIVRDDRGEELVYTSVLQLLKEKLQHPLSRDEEVGQIDPDDIGGI